MAFKPRAFATVFGGMLQMVDDNTSIGLVSGPNLSPHCFLTASRNVGPKESGWELRSQLLTPTTLPTDVFLSAIPIMKSATSAREMAKPKRGRWPSLTRYFPVGGLFVSSGGRTMVQSSPLFRKTSSIPDASATVSPKNNRPRKYAGGMMESLNRNATDSITTRLTPTSNMALVNVTAKRRRRSLSAFATG